MDCRSSKVAASFFHTFPIALILELSAIQQQFLLTTPAQPNALLEWPPETFADIEYKKRGNRRRAGHEYNHILHFDALNKIILAVILCIHWFNPIVWVMYFLANRDMELYCDEAVVRKGKKETRESYALALLHSVSFSNLYFSLSFSVGAGVGDTVISFLPEYTVKFLTL